MVPIACLMHWYISMMFVVPVVAVVGWCWLSGRRYAERNGGGPGRGPPSRRPGSPTDGRPSGPRGRTVPLRTRK